MWELPVVLDVDGLAWSTVVVLSSSSSGNKKSVVD